MNPTLTPTITTALLNGRGLQPTPYRAVSLADAAQHEPPGVYTVARTYHRLFALRLDAHLDRLEESSRLLGITLRLDRDELRATLRRLLADSGYPESRFRITVPLDDPDARYFAVAPFEDVPAEVRAGGAQVQCLAVCRENPRAKANAWARSRQALRAQLPEGIYEGLLTTPDGLILEGMSCNFYAIQNGELHTASEGMLHGIARQVVLELAPAILPVRETPVALADLPRLDEAFLTSSGRGVVPVTTIDGRPVGDGRPGPLTRAIEQRYNAWTESHLEPI